MRKKLILLCFCLTAIGGFCQPIQTPVYYLNGQETDLEYVYVKPSNIDSIRVGHKTAQGEVYIWMSKPVTFLTLDNILRNKGALTNAGEVVFVVDETLITDKWKVKIDASYSIELDVKHLNNIGYIDNKYHNLVIAQIKLNPSQMTIHGFQHSASLK